MKINYIAITAAAQKRADNCAFDHLYVGAKDSVERAQDGALYAQFEAEDEKNKHVVANIVEVVIQALTINRANGGVGRAVVKFEPWRGGIKGSYVFWTSINDEMTHLHEMHSA